MSGVDWLALVVFACMAVVALGFMVKPEKARIVVAPTRKPGWKMMRAYYDYMDEEDAL